MGPENPAFPVSRQAAKAEIAAMRDQPRPLTRPVVVINGWMDPGFATDSLVRQIRQATGDDRVVGVKVGYCPSMAACRAKVLAAAGRLGDVEVDVVTFSMGGLVARDAAIPQREGEPALRITRLMTIATPHRGANWAKLAFLGDREQAMKPGSAFLQRINAAEPLQAYVIVPYARLHDSMVGANQTAPPGQHPYWVPRPALEPGHLGAFRDPRIVADILRRLRGEAPLAAAEPTPLPE